MVTPFEDYLQHLASNLETRSYSGRNMYGKKCFAVECSMKELFQETLSYIRDNEGVDEGVDFYEIDAFINNAHEDSMGKGSIVYFPKYKPIEVEE